MNQAINVQFATFNQLTPNQLYTMLMQCVHVPRWAEDIEQQRPFADREALLEYAKKHAQSWTWEEVLSALETHPRIGERQAKVQLSEKEAQFSEQEQAALKLEEETLEALYKGNVAYEKKFRFIFLIRAAGRSSEEILTALHYRLVNDLYTEKRIVHQQLAEIALLRLEKEVDA